MKITHKFIAGLDKNTMKTLSVKDLIIVVDTLNEEFHENGNTLVSDDLFDEIKDYAVLKATASAKSTKSTDSTVAGVGAKVPKKEAVKLPYWMGSMKKFKPDNEKDLKNWIKKYTGPYVISDKLDGVSGLYDGNSGKLYTRGDGTLGRDISHLIPKLKGIPKNVPKDHVVRGEIIITKCDFNNLVDNDVIPESGNPRNTVAGITNAKTPNADILEYVKFVAYELIHPRMPAGEQLKTLSAIGFITANNIMSVDVTVNNLTNVLRLRKKGSPFEIDGIIIADSSKDHGVNTSGNPEHAFAFKLPTSEATVVVTDVIWQISKDRLAKPTVVFESVSLGGVTIKKATGFNAKFIIDNGIGPGAKIIITRSGDVIPYIKGVATATEPSLPTTYTYEFTKNGVDIVVMKDGNNEVSQQIDMKQFQNTVERLDIGGLKKASIEKLFKAGIVSLKQLFELDERSLMDLQLAAFGEKKVRSVIEAVDKVKKTLNCLLLMVASNAFGKGFSEKTLALIQAEYPQFMKTKPAIADLLKISGVGPETAKNFVANIDGFKKFVGDNGLGGYCLATGMSTTSESATGMATGMSTTSASATSMATGKAGKLSGMKILFSGSKDKELMKFITDNGGEIVSGISKSTSVLIMKDPTEESAKQKYAIKNSIGIMTPEEFTESV